MHNGCDSNWFIQQEPYLWLFLDDHFWHLSKFQSAIKIQGSRLFFLKKAAIQNPRILLLIFQVSLLNHFLVVTQRMSLSLFKIQTLWTNMYLDMEINRFAQQTSRFEQIVKTTPDLIFRFSLRLLNQANDAKLQFLVTCTTKWRRSSDFIEVTSW